MRRNGRPTRVAMIAIICAIGAGCGSSTPSARDAAGSTSVDVGSGATARAGANATDRDKAVRYAQCMRDNGVSKFPDPDASGALTLDGVANDPSVDASSAAFTKASAACKSLVPPGFTGHERSAQEQAIALEFARCVRDHGVKDFPDPEPGGPLVDTNRIPSTERAGGMSALNAAMKTCNDVAASLLGGR